MKTSAILTTAILTVCILFVDINDLFAQSREDIHITENTTWSGNVSVTANTQIDEGVTLTINPGTTVTFDGFYGLRVIGTILAEGTASDSIFFLPSSQSTGWNQIQFVYTNSSSDSSKFAYCDFKYSKANDESTLYGQSGGVFVFNYFSKISLRNSTLSHNSVVGLGGAIFCNYASPHIINNIFDNNSAVIDGGAIQVEHANPRIIGNLFSNNHTSGNGGALNFAFSSPQITNNTFADNNAEYWGGAIMVDNSSAPVFTNCILYNNSATEDGDEVAMNTNAGDPDFYYCIVSGGTAGFGGWGANDYNGNYENNLDADPRFTGSGDDPYNIQISSPCLNTGKPDLSGLHLPELDLAGHPRVAQGCEVRIDIGAYENQSQATTSFGGTLDQDAHWCADTVTITGDVSVSDGVTLTIEKGTVVYIAGGFNIDIKGNIVAIGEENDSVVFTTNSIWPYWWWRGISLHNLQAANDSSIFRFCRFSFSSFYDVTGGAMSIDNWNKIEISDCRFSNNIAYSKGGALAIQNTSITLTSCLISDNEGFYGGGLYGYNSTLDLINCTFTDNTAQNGDCNLSSPSNGGGMYLHNCSTTVSDCIITYNHADCDGGGTYSNGGSLELCDNEITFNHASYSGGCYQIGRAHV